MTNPALAFRRAVAFHKSGKLAEAERLCRAILASQPDQFGALHLAGVIAAQRGRFDDALASFDRALAANPENAEAWNNRGIALRVLKRVAEAATSFGRAVALEPDYVDALTNRGIARVDLGAYAEALPDLDRALTLEPDVPVALRCRGVALAQLGRHVDACRDLERALKLDPKASSVHEALHYSRMNCCDWTAFEEARLRVIADVRHGRRSGSPFWFLVVSDSPEDQLHCAQAWVREVCPPAPDPLWNDERYRHQRIRIAYLSSDFREHPVARLMVNVFERHDRARFETIGVSFGPVSLDPMRSRVRAAFETFIDVRTMVDAESARRLREREVDIVVDLNGFTTHARSGILALRPAPVQVNYLGYPATMGATYIDYIIADDVVIPPAQREFFTEAVVSLPDTYWPTDPRQPIAERVPTRGEAGLPETGFVFCSFNATYKLTPALFDVWMRLLTRIEGSVLWLRAGNDALLATLRREAMVRGVEPRRLVFAPKVAHADHLARHRLADLFLDTLPFNAHATASDALWAGLPVLTCAGATFAGRVAASLLHAIGLPELITTSLAEYETLAFRLATDGSLLAGIKQKLAGNRASFPLFDADRFCRHLEAAYVAMWERQQRGEPPASFAVEPMCNSAAS